MWSYRNTIQKRDKSPLWTVVNSLFESIKADLHTAEKANENLRKDVTLIKNTLDSIAGSPTPTLGNRIRLKSYAKALRTPLQQPPPATPKDCQIAVKVNNNDPNSQARAVLREQLVEHIN
ncbi:MAG: hypothetical protein M1839_003598 [Geoglossum umbratile]|nr:MAG: hypothetical protein M1839_003598 [Geoglossum umbratile]